MLIYTKGDILDSDCTVIMHQANCFKYMGAGIAKAIADKFPSSQIVDESLPLTPNQRYGHFSYTQSHTDSAPIVIVNLYGQFEPGKYKTEEEKYEREHMLHQAISNFLFFALTKGLDISKIGIPYMMGCGISGGDWNRISAIISILSEKYGVDIYVYQLD